MQVATDCKYMIKYDFLSISWILFDIANDTYSANDDYLKRDFVRTQLLPRTLTITLNHSPQGAR